MPEVPNPIGADNANELFPPKPRDTSSFPLNAGDFIFWPMGPANPFPGMNPYLEQRWGDVHASLILLTSDRLQETLPGDLRARMQERVFIEAAADPRRAVYRDVHVHERRGQLTEMQDLRRDPKWMVITSSWSSTLPPALFLTGVVYTAFVIAARISRRGANKLPSLCPRTS